MIKKIWLLWLGGLLIGCTPSAESGHREQPAAQPYIFRWSPQNSGVQAGLRGLSVVDTAVVWASGSQGTFLRTTDGGRSWKTGKVPAADTTDFRDIAAFDAETAYVLSAGLPALIYKTMDGGDTWLLQYENHTPGIFFDAFAFWDERHGIAMSDPVDGQFVLIHTKNGGDTWEAVAAGKAPEALTGEAGFAASGTGVAVAGTQHAWFATGGTVARIFRSTDGGMHWQATETPIGQGEASAGIFSLAMADTAEGVAVGGDYLQPRQASQTACFTTDGGNTWQPSAAPPKGYRSGVAYVPSLSLYLSVGTTGSDYSADGGGHWLPVDTAGYHALQFAPETSVGWAVGSHGKIAKVEAGPEK